MPRPIIVKILGIQIPPQNPIVFTDIARLSLPNVFLDVNTFPGIRFTPKIVTSDYTTLHTDSLVYADATDGPITITLEDSVGDGQFKRIKKIDSSGNSVTVAAGPGDTIEGFASIILVSQGDGFMLFDEQLNVWEQFPQPSFTDVARLSVENTFQKVNTFNGIRLMPRTVTSDFTFLSTDYEVLIDATGGPVTGTLPASIGSGQVYRAKKIDSSTNIVTIAAIGGDTIDGSISVNFSDQYADCTLIDASIGYWDNTGSANAGVSDFIDLGDVPSSYSGQASKVVSVKGDETGLEFSAGTPTAWGAITGTLSSQTDLQAALDAKVPTTRTVNGHALSSNVTVSASDVGLGSVTNDAQTKAAIVPNTAPSSGQHLVGNAGGTAYAPATISGSGATITCSSAGVITISAIANASLANSAITIAGTSTALGSSVTLDTITGVASNGLLKRTGANALTNVTAPSGAVVGDTDTQTLTNKRVTPRVTTITSSATPTINTDDCDAVTITALATAITSMTTNLSGTPTNFQKLIIRIKDDGTARAIAWGASFGSSQSTLPITTVLSKVLTVGLMWDSVKSLFMCIATDQEP